MLTGTINLNDKLVWTATPLHERITVIESAIRDQENWFKLKGKRGETWNSEEVIRESCIRAGSTIKAHLDENGEPRFEGQEPNENLMDFMQRHLGEALQRLKGEKTIYEIFHPGGPYPQFSMTYTPKADNESA